MLCLVYLSEKDKVLSCLAFACLSFFFFFFIPLRAWNLRFTTTDSILECGHQRNITLVSKCWLHSYTGKKGVLRSFLSDNIVYLSIPVAKIHVFFCFSSQGTVLGGYPLPNEIEIFVFPWLVHRHPEYYEEPLKFDPERLHPFMLVLTYFVHGLRPTGSNLVC